jgi:hypothetical protein
MSGRQHASVATVGMVDRSNATAPENAGDLVEVRRLIGWRHVDEHIERPHGVDRAGGDTGKVAPG